MRYVGVDLTSALSPKPRRVDIAFLEGDQVRLAKWNWPHHDVVLDSGRHLAEEFAAAIEWDPGNTVVALDGPQGLAKSGPIRQAELALATPGRTPSEMPRHDLPFATYIRSSISLFRALLASDLGFQLVGLHKLSSQSSNLFEVFPGAEWRVLMDRSVPKKSSELGRRLRGQLWKGLGFRGVPELPTADENDAIVAALLARWANTGEHPTVLAGSEPFGSPVVEGHILHAAAPLGISTELAEAMDRELEQEDWARDSYCLRLSDNSLVHGGHPDNHWLTPETNYLATVHHLGRVAIVKLTAARTFSGNRAWKCDPTPQVLLREHLGVAAPPSLSLTDSRVVRIEVIEQIPSE